LFALPGTSKRNKDLGASWFLAERENLRGGCAKCTADAKMRFWDVVWLDDFVSQFAVYNFFS